MPAPIDLRSDTVTRPTEAMRRAMAEAPVGDDVYGEDPTVNRLQEVAAQRLGFEAGLFVPSGVMGNQVAQLVLARRGSEVLVEADCHLVNYEDGAGALWAGVQYRTVRADRGLLSAELVHRNVRDGSFHDTPTSLVAIEQTHNRRGGTYADEAGLRELRKTTDELGVPLYVDGARVWNAIVAGGQDPTTYGQTADALCFCISKGLGAPVGSVLLGSRDFIAEAHRWRKRLGGGMRQAGVLAAAGLHALDHHVTRLADDHANARTFARAVIEEAPEAVELDAVATNIVLVRTGDHDPTTIADQAATEGVLIHAFGPHLVRAVTHLDVDEDGCRRAGAIVGRLLAGAAA